MRYIFPIVLAASLLAGCSVTDTGEADTAEPADETQQPTESIDYIQDIGLIDDALREDLHTRLSGFHGESGHEIHIAVILTTDNQDIEERAAAVLAERGIGEDGALILIALADETIAIVPASGTVETLTTEFTDATEAEMAEQFDARQIAEGLNGALDAIMERLDG